LKEKSLAAKRSFQNDFQFLEQPNQSVRTQEQPKQRKVKNKQTNMNKKT